MTAGPDPSDEAPTPRTTLIPSFAIDRLLEAHEEEMPFSSRELERARHAENEDEAPATLRSG